MSLPKLPAHLPKPPRGYVYLGMGENIKIPDCKYETRFHTYTGDWSHANDWLPDSGYHFCAPINSEIVRLNGGAKKSKRKTVKRILKITQGVHHLKTWPAFYPSVEDRSKPFEVRKNDRDFKVGDLLILEEWNPNTAKYTGRNCKRTVTFVLDGGAFGIEKGFCIMGLGIDRRLAK